ncbi:cell surface A33 antigen-like [Antennarius striatus]|uniref:cell surface A33 antigen-like n=1 Tax=Antennarius striatus TaxID=241820 RepID=UPI0035AFD7F2
MEGSVSTLTLMCVVLLDVSAIQVKIPQNAYEAARGDNITLPCTFTPKSTPDLVIIAWNVEGQLDSDELRILSYFSHSNTLDIKQKYERRVSLDVDIPSGKANLQLYNVGLQDNKMFECRVTIPGDDEGQPFDKTNLTVLVAPSKPICKIQGKAEYGQNINLTCKSEEGSPPPTYKWESRDVRNVLRPPSPRTTDKNGIMSLFNISRDTSGFYICTSANKIRSATCNLTLSVMPPSMNIGSTAGIIGGVVAALIVLVIVIYCCCCRKKKQQEEYAMGVREEEYHDKEPAINGDSRQVEGQEDREGYDDSSVRNPSDRNDRYEERSERDYDRRRVPDDRPRSDYDDPQSDYDDRRSDYSARRDRYDDRDERYDDPRDRRNDDRYNDRRDRRYDDRYDDRYDEPYDDREQERPSVPVNKPPRRDDSY